MSKNLFELVLPLDTDRLGNKWVSQLSLMDNFVFGWIKTFYTFVEFDPSIDSWRLREKGDKECLAAIGTMRTFSSEATQNT